MRMVALIPARAGSRRIPGKNTKLLAGHPLIAYTIAAAQQSGVFTYIAIAADDESALSLAQVWSVTRIWREPASDDQPDIVWVRQALSNFRNDNTSFGRPEAFAILRPTSPFRTADTIRRAFEQFHAMGDCCDSLRAVEPVKQHPYKMWICAGPGYPITPLHPGAHPDGTPWHSSPTQSLSTVYVQNSSLEMAWTRCVEVFGTISGRKVAPFFTQRFEGFSIDYPEDWARAEHLIATGQVKLPDVHVSA